jgi:hypothetical protein
VVALLKSIFDDVVDFGDKGPQNRTNGYKNRDEMPPRRVFRGSVISSGT